MTALGRMKAIRAKRDRQQGPAGYEEDIIRGVFFSAAAPSSSIRRIAIRHVLSTITRIKKYTRTPASFRVLRPLVGDGLLTARAWWKHQRERWPRPSRRAR